MKLLRRLLNVFRPERVEREFDDELEFHREMRLRKARERGLTESEAQTDTDWRMGNVALAKEEMHDARVVGWLDSTLQDLRHGAVLLRRDAGVSALIVLVLALGIGANTTMFALLKAAFLDPLPYRDANRLVTVVQEGGWTPSAAEYLELRSRSRTLDEVAFAEHRDMQITESGEPTRVFGARVTASFFPLLGVSVARGRTFFAEDNQPQRTPSIVLTDAFWRAKFGSDTNVIGRTLRLDGAPAVIVGILPAGFHFSYPTLRIPEPVEIYVAMPLEATPVFRSTGFGASNPFRVLARIAPETTRAQAESELQSIAQALMREHPDAYRTRDGGKRELRFEAQPLREAIVGTQRSLLMLLLGGVCVLLLIACANAAQLLLARSLRRGREVAVRSALGASRLRLIRQFLMEGVVLAVCGGAAGLLLAGWMAKLLVALLPERSPLLEAAHLDWRVVGFTLVVSLLCALVFAIVPAIKGSKWTPGPALSARAATGEGNRWRHIMVAIETALSVFLLCGAGLIAQNMWTLLSTSMGFDKEHVFALRLKQPPSVATFPNPNATNVLRDYLEHVAAIPGVESAATVTGLPLHPVLGGPAELVGVKESSGRLKSVIIFNHMVSPDYFRVMRIPFLAGRTFTDAEAVGPRLTAIVNEEFARQFGVGRDVVGMQIFEPGTPIPIVGMISDVRVRGRDVAPMPEVFLSSYRYNWVAQHMVIRSALDPGQLVKQVTHAIRAVNPDQAVYGVMTMDEMIDRAVAQPRFHTYLIGAFALLAVAMAASGMYSVISCLVSQRTSEIALRIALGASRGAIVRTVMARTFAWVIAGLALGLAFGLATRKTLQSLSDLIVDGSPWMYAGVLCFFLIATLVAVYVPVRRASRLDPAVALRCE